MADCKKCAIKHHRPVGVRCRQNFNSSESIIDLYRQNNLTHDKLLSQQQEVHVLQGRASNQCQMFKQLNGANLESKLDSILKKMEQCESKNFELEKRSLSSQSSRNSSRISHSSPKKSHNCA